MRVVRAGSGTIHGNSYMGISFSPSALFGSDQEEIAYVNM
jgi:hypothetical protein